MWSCIRAASILQLLVLCWGCPAFGAEEKAFWYSAAVNHVDANLSVRLVQLDGQLYVRHLDLVVLNLDVPDTVPRILSGERFYAGDALPGHRLSVDHLQQRAYFFSRQNPHLTAPPSDDLLLTVTANGRTLPEPLYLRYEAGELMVPEETMEVLGVVPPKIWSPGLAGAMPLHALAGEHFALDYSQLALDTRLMPDLLEEVRINVTERRLPGGDVASEVQASHGLTAMVNYDLLTGHSESTAVDAGDSTNRWHSGFFEFSVGSGNSHCAADYYATREGGTRRLNAYCQQDWPEQRITAVAGETYGASNILMQPLRYGGIRIGSDFSLQPRRLTIPYESVRGIVDQPAVLELWIDKALGLRTEIPAGPFELEEIPLRMGAGELHAYITPLFGDQQYINYGFYVDRALLMPGLSEWALEAGRLRENRFGGEDVYTDSFLAASLRRGITRRLTLGMALQGSENLQLASLGAAFTLGHIAALDAAIAASRENDAVSDPAWRVRISHQGSRFNASWSHERNPGNYRELAWTGEMLIPERRRQVSLGMRLPRGMSLLLQESYQSYRRGTEFGLRTVGLSMPIGRLASFRVTASRTVQDDADTLYAAHLTIPLGRRESVSLSARREGEREWKEFSLQRSLPAGTGFGYRMNLADTPTGGQGLIDLQAQNGIGRLGLQGSQYGDSRQISARASGSVLLSSSGIDLSRRAQGSYAVVQLGAAGIPVYHGGQLKAFTNADGEALIPGLRPFEYNRIHIRAEDVPMDVQPRQLETIVRPGRRELVRVDFRFQRERYFTGRLIDPNGEPIAAGSQLILPEQDASLVGRDGEFFLTSSSTALEFEVRLPEGSCHIRIDADANDGQGLVTEVGERVCEIEESQGYY